MSTVLLAGGPVTPAAASASPQNVADLGTQTGFGRFALDSTHGHVFVSEPEANSVAELDLQGRLVTTITGLPGAWGLVVGGNYLYVAAQNAGYVARVHLTASTPSAKVFVSGLSGPRWLAYAAGRLWVGTAPSEGESRIVAVDPATGSEQTFGGSYYGADLAVSPADPNALYMAEAEDEPSAVHRFDLASFPPAQTAENARFWSGAWSEMALSSDGSRLEAAAGADGGFQELCSQTLQPDGVTYPGADYPAGVATSSSGLLATALTGYDSPNLALYRVGVTTPVWSATSSGTEQIEAGGLAITPDGRTLYAAVDGSAPDGPALLIETYALPAAPAGVASDPCPKPASGSSGGTPAPGGVNGHAHTGVRPVSVTLRVLRRGHPSGPAATFVLTFTVRPRPHHPKQDDYVLSLSRLRCVGHANALLISLPGRQFSVPCTDRHARRSGVLDRTTRYVVREIAVHRNAGRLRTGMRYQLILKD